jgi:dienelactone hydrolase
MAEHSPANPASTPCLPAGDASWPTRRLYEELCQLDRLRKAHAQLQGEGGNFEDDTSLQASLAENGRVAFLQQLSSDLQAGTYRPAVPGRQAADTSVARADGPAAVCDRVVQVALAQLLADAFPPAFPSGQGPDKTIRWLAGNLERGFYRALAVNLTEGMDARQYAALLERATARIGDPRLALLLREVLAASAPPGQPPHGPLAAVLADIALAGIDRILLQARTLGREDNFLHLQCTRAGNELVVLADGDPRYDWLLPAVRQRLREELSQLPCDLAAVESQAVDLSRDGRLRFLGFELRLVAGKKGEQRVHCERLEKPDRGPAESRRRQGHYRPLRRLGNCLKGLQHLPGLRSVREAWVNATSIRVGWRHLPLTLYPVVVFLFGWRSPAAWLCLAALVLCNARRLPGTAHSAGGWVWRHMLDVAMAACALAAVACMVPWLRDVYANRPQEVRAPAHLPPGFFKGRFRGDSWFGTEPACDVAYGLYVPPHLQDQKGPFPLLVFLHGYEGKTPQRLFKSGFLAALAHRIAREGDGRCDFVAFAPIDPTGEWGPKSAEVQAVLQTLDYVAARHRIDPARVWLTGAGEGGDGVWRLAEAYPERWAALAPVGSSYCPDARKVRHLPVCIFAGAPDQPDSVQPAKRLQADLARAGADVQYREVSRKARAAWTEVYGAGELYGWLATKKREVVP